MVDGPAIAGTGMRVTGIGTVARLATFQKVTSRTRHSGLAGRIIAIGKKHRAFNRFLGIDCFFINFQGKTMCFLNII